MIVAWGKSPIPLGILGQTQASPYMPAAEAIGARFRELNAATSRPAILYPLSTALINQMWGTPEARQGRINFYLRSIAIHSRRLRRSVLEQGRTRYPDGYTEGHYAGIVIRLLEREMPDMDVGILFSIGDVAIDLMRWTRGRYPDMPPGFVCDVILMMTGYFGIPEEERPGEGIPSGPAEGREEGQIGNIALKIGVSVASALIIFALTRGRKR